MSSNLNGSDGDVKRVLSQIQDAVGQGEDADAILVMALQAEERAAAEKHQMCLQKLGVQIHKIEQYKGDIASYRIHTDRGVVQVPNTQELFSQAKLRALFGTYLQMSFRTFKAGEWDEIRSALITLCEPVEVGPEEYAKERVKILLQDYVHRELNGHRSSVVPMRRGLNSSDHREFAPLVVDDNGLYLIYGKRFFDWTAEIRAEDPRSVIRKQMKALKCKGGIKVNYSGPNPTSTTYWRIPAAIVRAPKPDQE